MTLSRRSFLHLTAGATLLPAALRAAPLATVTNPGLQLYSLRDDMEKDARATISAVAKMGYKEIESYPGSKGFLWGMKPAEFRGFLNGLGLAPAATHCGIEPNMQKVVDEAAAGGFKNLVVSWIAKEKRADLDGFKRVAEELNRYGELARNAGLGFGYHNHDYPFMDMAGQVPFDVLVQNTDPRYVQFELDVFWVIEPGKDPIKYFEKYPGRITMTHLKDRDPADAKKSTVIGQGNLDLAKMMTAARKSGVKHYFVEVEEYGTLTPIESVRQSIAGLKKIQF